MTLDNLLYIPVHLQFYYGNYLQKSIVYKAYTLRALVVYVFTLFQSVRNKYFEILKAPVTNNISK